MMVPHRRHQGAVSSMSSAWKSAPTSTVLPRWSTREEDHQREWLATLPETKFFCRSWKGTSVPL